MTLFDTVQYIVYDMTTTEQWLREWAVTVLTDRDSWPVRGWLWEEKFITI